VAAPVAGGAKKGGAGKKAPLGGWAKGKDSKAPKKSKADEIRESQLALRKKKEEDDERARVSFIPSQRPNPKLTNLFDFSGTTFAGMSRILLKERK